MTSTLFSCIAAIAAVGCSLAIDADRQQCAADSDCSDNGVPGTCTSAGICSELASGSGGGSGSGGATGSGGGNGIGNTPNDWSCVGKPPKPSETNGPFTVTLRIANILASTGAYSGATAKLCQTLDLSCATPIRTEVTNLDGRVTFDGLAKNFSSFVWFTRPATGDETEQTAMSPTLFFFNRHIEKDILDPPLAVQAVTPDLIATLTAAAGAPQVEGNGISLNSIFDCAGKAAAEVRFKLLKKPQDTNEATIFYAVKSLPNADATQTDTSGFGGLVNATPGTVTLEAWVGPEDDEHKVATSTFVIKPNSLTHMRLVPDGF